MVARSFRSSTELAAACASLGQLVADVQALAELLDLALGAAASFIRAAELGYVDRLGPLPDSYYENLRRRATRMADGTFSFRGRWTSGYYFNSGLMRLWAARDQLRGIEKGIARQGLRISILSSDAELQLDANRLKHDKEGLGPARTVKFDAAIRLLAELITNIEQQKSVFGDPSLKPRPMSSGPRHRGAKAASSRAAASDAPRE